MSKVLIVGAGASFGHGFRPEAAKRPPLVNGFLGHPVCADLEDDYKELFDYLQNARALDMQTLAHTDLEKLIGELEPLWGLHVLESKAAYGSRDFEYDEGFQLANPIELLRAFMADVIFLSTEWLSVEDCPYHDRLVCEWLSDGDVVLSFNYDLVLDTSLRRHSTWREGTGYGWNAGRRPTGYLIEDWSEREEPYVSTGVRLLKLHGSLNFSRCFRHRAKERFTSFSQAIDTKSQTKDTETEEYESVAVTPIDTFWTTYKARYLPSLCKQYSEQFNRVQREFFQIMKWANRGKDTYELGILPLMIVPTPYKPFSQMVFGELRDIWRQAFESLREADEALACGFSFRDDHFNQILREATRSRGCPLNLTVVDPSVHTLKHIEATLSMCNINPTLLATDLGDFVEGLV